MSDLLDVLGLAETPTGEWWIDPKDSDPRKEVERQIAVLSLGKQLCPGVCFFAIPNAGRRSDWERLERWREGARNGALDLVAHWNRGVAFLEMKDGKGMPTAGQRDMLDTLYRQGHHCGVFRQEESVFAQLREWGAPFLVGKDEQRLLIQRHHAARAAKKTTKRKS